MPYDEEGRFIYPQVSRKTTKKLPHTSATPKGVSNSPQSTSGLEKAQASQEPNPPISSKDAIPAKPANKIVSAADVIKKTKSKEGLSFEKFGEIGLAYLWNAQCWPFHSELVTTKGEKVQIVYRGRWSGNFGPDFKGAILEIGGELRHGDVELHLKTSGWKQHGHQEDKRYENVILHVVLEDDVFLIEDVERPVLALTSLFEDVKSLENAIELAKTSGTELGSVSESAGPCCDRVAERHPNLQLLLNQIDEMGESRFLSKAWQFEAACSAESGGAAQSLWSGILEALGYSQNKLPFRRLAATLPFATIIEIELSARKKREANTERLLTLESALLGAAGLLPSQRRVKKQVNISSQGQKSLPDISKPDKILQKLEKAELQEDWVAGRYVDELERRWQFLERHIRAVASFEAEFKPLEEPDWTFARLRPPNHPSRRIAGLARLLSRLEMHDEESLYSALVQVVMQAVSPAAACAKLKDYFTISLTNFEVSKPKSGHLSLESESDDFWSRRFDFTDRAILVSDPKAKAGLDLVGADRAADIVVNVALPFLVGFARYRGDTALEGAALAAYRIHPRLGSNELLDKVARQVFRYWLENNNTSGNEEITFLGLSNKKLTVNKLLETACRQQGLLHIHRQFCTEQDYNGCPLA